MIKDAVEKLYFDKCDVYEYNTIKNPLTHQTKNEEEKVLNQIPCKLVYKYNIDNVSIMENGASSLNQLTKLIISPDYNIKAGSKIIVTKQTGQTVIYKSSGQPSYYSSHQEIALELFKKWG